jgi:hypothetical protein
VIPEIEAAYRRGQAEDAEHRPIDYAAANAAFKRQRTALRRAVASGDSGRIQREVVKTVREWNAAEWPWPDHWRDWQAALDDALPFNRRVELRDIR